MGSDGIYETMSVTVEYEAVTWTAPLVALSSQPSAPRWRHLHDIELGGVRDIVLQTGDGRPEVFVLNDGGMDVRLTRDWQFYLVAINPGMALSKVAALMGTFKAFCNGTGTGDPNKPKADFIKGECLTCELPTFDKVRTCGGALHSGHVEGAYLVADMLDGSQPPPLKSGRRQPQTLAEIDLGAYLFNPIINPELFFAAVNVQPDGRVTPFDGGGVYAWTGDNRPYTFLPHVSRVEVRVPLADLVRVPDGAPLPSPYLER